MSLLVGKKETTMELKNLRDLFMHEIRDLYSCERQVLDALPQMEARASSPDLKRAFHDHIEQTRAQARRLEEFFTTAGENPGGVSCEGIKGIIAEGRDMMQSASDPDVCDAGLIGAAQRVEHYEMAGYGCARSYAQTLGEDTFAKVLGDTLTEEKRADRRLTELAEERVNVKSR
jgi:ferritin-like metal-binding protein YciE